MKPIVTVLMVLFAWPAFSQTALQQFLAAETGYAPPQMSQPAPAPVQVPAPQPQQYTTIYAPAPVYPQPVYTQPADNAAPDGYYEDSGSDVGPSGENPSLRALMTSSGF